MDKRPTYEELEKQLKIAQANALKSEDLKNAFLANISHEIRTPMNAIIGASELLRDQSLTQCERDDFTCILSTSSRELLDLFNRIIELSELESGWTEINESEIDINTLFTALLANYNQQIKGMNKNVSLTFSEDIPDISIITDFEKLKKTLCYLLDNAVKFTETGQIEFGLILQDSNNLLFYVKDTGPGIKLVEQENIFHKFRQADNSYTREYSGAGLGLSLSREIVKLLGGRLYLESYPGKGSLFYFTLPLKYSDSNLTIKNKIEKKVKRSFFNKYSLGNVNKNIAI